MTQQSEEHTTREQIEAVVSPIMKDLEVTLLKRIDAALDQAFENGATAMRDKCVEMVKEMRDQHNRDYEYWKSIASEPDRDFGVLKFAAWAGEDERVISALESLTLDQVKPGEM